MQTRVGKPEFYKKGSVPQLLSLQQLGGRQRISPSTPLPLSGHWRTRIWVASCLTHAGASNSGRSRSPASPSSAGSPAALGSVSPQVGFPPSSAELGAKQVDFTGRVSLDSLARHCALAYERLAFFWLPFYAVGGSGCRRVFHAGVAFGDRFEERVSTSWRRNRPSTTNRVQAQMSRRRDMVESERANLFEFHAHYTEPRRTAAGLLPCVSPYRMVATLRANRTTETRCSCERSASRCGWRAESPGRRRCWTPRSPTLDA